LPDGMIQPRRIHEKVLSLTFTVVLGLGICAISFGLWRVPLRWYVIQSDDFDYLVRGRTAAALTRHLFTPHNGHIVPLFRLQTHSLGRIAGSLEALPGVLGWASFGTLVLAILLTGHLVARETSRPDRGLIAMAAVGFSSVLGPAVLWYSASQALACGTVILAMLAALERWRARGGHWPLVLGLLLATAAPLFWTAGFIAGLVGAAYLLADGRLRFRRAAVLPLALSVLSWFMVRVVLTRFSGVTIGVGEARLIWNNVRPGPGVLHAAQAFCELLVKNAGLDTTTTGPQAVVILSIMAALWLWSRRRFDPNHARRWPRINPLEAAGAVLIAASLGLIYSVRGTLASFDEMRTQGWYDAIAELGTVLFVFGWRAGPIESPPPRALEYPGRRELLESVLAGAVILVLQVPRVERVIFRYEGMGAPSGPDSPIHPLVRTEVDLARQARDQRHVLALLDRLERRVREEGLSRAEIEHTLLNTPTTGLMIEAGSGHRVIELLDIPETRANPD
jgi:hypothetical protein